MAETGSESAGRRDLTTFLSGVDPEIVELFGEEKVAQVEALAEITNRLAELSRHTDPFKRYPGKYEDLTPPVVRGAVREVERLDNLMDSSDPAIIPGAREAAPVLAKNIEEQRHYLAANYNGNSDRFKPIVTAVNELSPDVPTVLVEVAPQLQAELDAIAQDIANLAMVDNFKTVVDAEDRALYIDGLATELAQKPEIELQLAALDAEMLALRRQGLMSRYRRVLEEQAHLAVQTAHQGMKRRSVRKAHRSQDKMIFEDIFLDDLVERLAKIRERGSQTHDVLQAKVSDGAHEPGMLLFGHLMDMRQILDTASADGDRRTAAQIEAYIVGKASDLECAMRQTQLKLNADGRRKLHELKDSPIERSLRQLAISAIGRETNPHEQIEADPAFRQACRDAKDILAGGGRLKHPDARKLSDELHRLRFGKNGETALLPAESGIVVGIVAGRFNSLVHVLERVSASRVTVDEQVAKLRFELPDQYGALSKFSLEAAVEKLGGILRHPDDAGQLLNALPSIKDSENVRRTVLDLLKRQEEIGEAVAEPAA